MGFEQEIAHITSGLPSDEMTSVYHTRDSYVEALFEGVNLVPLRGVSAELRHPTFSFVPDDTRRRLIKHSKIHFLARRLRQLALLILATVAFFPTRWFFQPEWRAALINDFGIQLPSTLTPQPWITLGYLGSFAAGLSWL